ncbi:unnamed protein product [Urochloa humidicola]
MPSGQRGRPAAPSSEAPTERHRAGERSTAAAAPNRSTLSDAGSLDCIGDGNSWEQCPIGWKQTDSCWHKGVLVQFIAGH